MTEQQTGPLWVDAPDAPTVEGRPMDHKAQPKKKDKGPVPARQGNGYYADHLTGDRLRSVTTILGGGVPKPALLFWAAITCTDAAIEALPQLVAASRNPQAMAELRDWIKRAHTRKKDERADVGSAVHAIIEARLLGQPIPEALQLGEELVRLDSEDLAPFVGQIDRFLLEWEPEFTASEMVVANPIHGYAGTLDFMLRSTGKVGAALRAAGFVVPEDADLMGDTKGLPLDTPLPTPTGWTTMGAVQVGDALLGRDGLPCTVTQTSEIHERDCFRVTFDDGSSVVCDDEHRWLTDTGVQDWQIQRQVASTVELRTTLTRYGQRQHRVPVAEPLDLPPATLPIEPYVLGVWLGDGKHTSGEISSQDPEVFEHIEALGYDLGPVQKSSREGGCPVRTVYSLVPALRTAGVLGHKHIPTAYLRASRGQREALLQGLMDTDGTWNKARNSAQFVSVDKAFASSVRELALSLGQRATMYEANHTGFKPGVHYVVRFTPVGVVPFRLARKADLVQVPSTVRSSRRLIVSIEPTITVPTKCIAVNSSDRTFLCTEAMIPTHNTGGDWDRVTSMGHVHGVYPEAGLQMSAYRKATIGRLRDGTRVPMPATAAVGVVLHLRPEGYRLYPARCGDREYAYFRHAQMVDEWSSRIASAKADDPVIGAALQLVAAAKAVA